MRGDIRNESFNGAVSEDRTLTETEVLRRLDGGAIISDGTVPRRSNHLQALRPEKVRLHSFAAYVSLRPVKGMLEIALQLQEARRLGRQCSDVEYTREWPR